MEKNREQLKNIALRQRIGEITSNYEETIATLRVEVTILSDAVESLQSQLQEQQDLASERELAEDDDAA